MRLGEGIDTGTQPGLHSGSVPDFPSMKAPKLLRLLCRSPLSYSVTRQRGSHRKLESDNYPPLLYSFHDNQTVTSGLVRKILVRDVGLDEDEAYQLAIGA